MSESRQGAASRAISFLNPFINLYSRDVEAGLRFYRDLLGFKETFRAPKVGTLEHVELTLGGFGIGLSPIFLAV